MTTNSEIYTLTFVEIDIWFCSLTFGESPCTATGDNKCFNTRNRSHDCQDPANYTPAVKTVRFAIDCGFLPSYIDAFPNLISAEMTPAKVDPGESLGQRATLSCKFKNHRHGDVGFDKYIGTRDYIASENGTFWGKFIARNPYLYRRPIRLIQGVLGQAIEEMDTYHFVIEKVDGVDSDGVVTISAVDFMRFFDGDNAQVPQLSNGRLSADIDDVETSATLTPTGIGAAEYPSSGTISIGEELCTFTRSGDVLTLVRAAHGSEAKEHKQDETVQLCYSQTGQNEATILEDLIVNYTDLDASYIDSTAWQTEVTENSNLLYTGLIPKPTPVVKIINEFIQHAGLVVYPDLQNKKINLTVIRPVSSGAIIFDDDNTFPGMQVTDTGKRFSQIWTYFNIKNKMESLDKDTNYYTIKATFDDDNPYETDNIKKLFSRWLPGTALSAATTINNRFMSRYKVAPRQFSFSVLRGNGLKLGQAINVTSWVLEDAFGNQEVVPCQIISIRYLFDRVAIVAEELRFNAAFLTSDRVFLIDNDTLNLNLRSLHDSVYSNTDSEVSTRFIIASGTKVGSSSTSVAAIVSGSWPEEIVPEIVNHGIIAGRGGDGGSIIDYDGLDGGVALHFTVPVSVDNDDGIIGGGGGGGGSTRYALPPGQPAAPFLAGGGGAGYNVGTTYSSQQSSNSTSATTTTGGSGTGGTGGGAGGDLGEDGVNGYTGSVSGGITATGGTAGSAGAATDSESLITWVNEGDIRGARTG